MFKIGEIIIVSLVLVICALVFIGIGIVALKKEKPMHFWSGSEVKSEEITDVKAYNRANGVMWIIYGCVWCISAISGLIFGNAIGIIMVVLNSTVGIVLLIVVYRYIYKKYKS